MIETSTQEQAMTNGPGAAAILAAGVGCFALGVLAVLGDVSPAFKKLMIFYKPTGPLSGVTTCAVLIWIVVWALLEWRLRRKSVQLGRASIVALVLLGLGLLLTFPPVADLF
jgi:hypothetical protein